MDGHKGVMCAAESILVQHIDTGPACLLHEHYDWPD